MYLVIRRRLFLLTFKSFLGILFLKKFFFLNYFRERDGQRESPVAETFSKFFYQLTLGQSEVENIKLKPGLPLRCQNLNDLSHQ